MATIELSNKRTIIDKDRSAWEVLKPYCEAVGSYSQKRPAGAYVGLRIGQNVNTLWNNPIQVCIA